MLKKAPSEHLEGMLLCAWLRKQGLKFSHIANESGTSRPNWGQLARRKQLGVTKGVPDYVIVCPRVVLFVELKKAKGGRASSEQVSWVTSLTEAGCPSRICHGANEAIEFVKEHL